VVTPKSAAPGQQPPSGLTGRAVRVLRSRDEAEAYVASVCFKHGPPTLLGVELEWLLIDAERPGRPLRAATLRTALGSHAPPSLDPRSPQLPLPAGSAVTVEPGGQVELATRPVADLGALVTAAQTDSAALLGRLAAHGLQPRPFAADPQSPPRRVLSTPRYDAMEAAFDRLGGEGRSMMCSTAAVQPSLDPGEPSDLQLRWTALHALGPALVAAFANSPRLHGRDTGWKSSRMGVWLALDPPRTAPPDLPSGGTDPAPAYARRAMEAGLVCVRRRHTDWGVPAGISFADWLAGALPEPPTTADLDLHLSTLFPPVRPHGHLEVRYLDAQAGEEWIAPVAVLCALLADPVTTSRAVDVCLPVAGRWADAARVGLADREIARAAAAVCTLAAERLSGLVGPGPVRQLVEYVVQDRVLRGLCPADLGGYPAWAGVGESELERSGGLS
jgi:glutamate--cysteine ligase